MHATEFKTTDITCSETPFWLYVPAGAEMENKGEYPGEMGGRIVAEVIFERLRHDSTPFISDLNCYPELARAVANSGSLTSPRIVLGDRRHPPPNQAS